MSMDRAAFAMRYLMAKGYTPTMASGIVGNLMAESRVTPTGLVGDRGTAFGVAQWRGNRFDNLRGFAGAQGRDWRDIRTQLDFVDHEMRPKPEGDPLRGRFGNGSEATAFRALQNARNPQDSGARFAMHYERPQGSQTGNPANIHAIGTRTGWAGRLFNFVSSGGNAQPAQPPDTAALFPTAQAVRPVPDAQKPDAVQDIAVPQAAQYTAVQDVFDAPPEQVQKGTDAVQDVFDPPRPVSPFDAPATPAAAATGAFDPTPDLTPAGDGGDNIWAGLGGALAGLTGGGGRSGVRQPEAQQVGGGQDFSGALAALAKPTAPATGIKPLADAAPALTPYALPKIGGGQQDIRKLLGLLA